MAGSFLRLRLTCCVAVLATFGAISVPGSAAVLAVGHGSGTSPEAARAEARADLALRLQRRAAAQIDRVSGKTAVSIKRAITGGRELPLVEIEIAASGARGGEVLYEARLTDTSLAAYERQAMRLAERLRRTDPARLRATRDSTAEFTDAFAQLDQYLRISAVLSLFSSAAPSAVKLHEAALWSSAAKNLSPVAGAKDIARKVKLDLERANIAQCRVIAPVRTGTGEATPLSALIAEELLGGACAAGRDEAPPHTLDGRYTQVDGRLLLTLFLLDASFNTQQAFVFVLPAAAEQPSRGLSTADGFAATLSRGLVRVELPSKGGAAPPLGNAIEVDVRMGRGNRGLYYRPGEREKLLVKLDRPGYYYIVGHLQKGAERFSYLMEIGDPGATDRFVRRVAADQAHRWQTAGDFTVAPPIGLEAVQVFATSGPPQKRLPETRFDPARKLHLIGTDPIDAIKRARGLVLVHLPDPRNEPSAKVKPASLAVGEAVLQFSTLP
jgi:hypothetical protein